MVKEGRLIIEKGKKCQYHQVCKRPCIAKYPMENEFSCGLYKENIEEN